MMLPQYFRNCVVNQNMLRKEFYRTRDHVLKANWKSFRISITRCTEAVNETISRFDAKQTRPEYASAIGSCISGCIGAASFLKGDERVSAGLYVRDNKLLARSEVLHSGQMRACLNPSLDYLNDLQLLQPCDEHGFKLEVQKVLYGKTEAYHSIVHAPKVDRLWDSYFAQSEQVPTLVASHTVATESTVKFCGGIIVQALVDSNTSVSPKENLDLFQQKFPQQLLESQLDEWAGQEARHAGEWLSDLLQEKNPIFEIEERTVPTYKEGAQVRPITYFCPCSSAGFATKIKAICEDVDTVFDGQESAELRCDYCNRVHIVNRSDCL